MKLHNALAAGIPMSIDQELQELHTEYFQEAVGPAVSDAYSRLRAESLKLEDDLSLIPGCIPNLRIVGTSYDRIKLKWTCPVINAPAVEHYKIMIKSKDKEWELVSTSKGLSAIVTGLESSKWYCIAVFAANQKYSGGQCLYCKVKTAMSKAAWKGVVVTGAIVGFLAHGVVGAAIATYVLTHENRYRDITSNDTEELHWKGQSTTMLDVIELPSDSEEFDEDGVEQLQSNDLEESGDKANDEAN